MSDREPLVFLNDDFVPASAAHLNIFDLGIVLGATLTEMTRTFAQATFRASDHVSRLYRSARYAGIDLTLSPAEMLDRTEVLVKHNAALLDESQELGIVHFVTPGENEIYAGSAAGPARLLPTVCIHSFPMPFQAWSHFFTEGVHLVTPSIRHIPPQCIDPKMKNRSRLHWWIADQQSHAVDARATSLLLDLDGNITECSGSNIVLVKDRTIYSPTSRNILEGVSLVTVRELAPKLGLAWVEKDLQPYDVVNADEVWLTTTPYCMAPCTKLNGVTIGDGSAGPVFGEMMAAWSDLVGLDIVGQILQGASMGC